MSETATVTLADFLLARIAEDEAAIDGDWTDGYDLHILSEPMRNRMLAEVEAKRRIMEEHPPPSYIGTPGARLACDRCSDLGGPYGYDDPENWIDWPCPTLRAIAVVYADHPDFRAEWRP